MRDLRQARTQRSPHSGLPSRPRGPAHRMASQHGCLADLPRPFWPAAWCFAEAPQPRPQVLFPTQLSRSPKKRWLPWACTFRDLRRSQRIPPGPARATRCRRSHPSQQLARRTPRPPATAVRSPTWHTARHQLVWTRARWCPAQPATARARPVSTARPVRHPLPDRAGIPTATSPPRPARRPPRTPARRTPRTPTRRHPRTPNPRTPRSRRPGPEWKQSGGRWGDQVAERGSR